MGLSLTTLLPLLLSMLGRGKPAVELPIKEVIDIIGSLPPLQQDEAVEVIDIAKAQQMLKDLGFDPGPIDGKPGALTRAAVLASREVRFIVAAHLGSDPGDVVPPTRQDISNDPISALTHVGLQRNRFQRFGLRGQNKTVLPQTQTIR